MSKLYQSFQSLYSLPKPSQNICFSGRVHTTFFSVSKELINKIYLFYLFINLYNFIYKLLGVSEFVVKSIRKNFFQIFLWRSSSLTKTTDSCFLLKKYLIVISRSHINLSLHHFIMYVCCWRRNLELASQKQATRFLLLTKSTNTRKFCFSVCFLSYFRFFRFRFLV